MKKIYRDYITKYFGTKTLSTISSFEFLQSIFIPECNALLASGRDPYSSIAASIHKKNQGFQGEWRALACGTPSESSVPPLYSSFLEKYHKKMF